MEMNTKFLYFIIYAALFLKVLENIAWIPYSLKNNIFSYETIIYSMSWIDTSNVARSFNSSTFVH